MAVGEHESLVSRSVQSNQAKQLIGNITSECTVAG